MNWHKCFASVCEKGYTILAIRPGSVSKFTVLEILININLAINYIKSTRGPTKIKQKFGLTGASAGGHLACLTVVQLKAKREKFQSNWQPQQALKRLAFSSLPQIFLTLMARPSTRAGRKN